MAGLDPAIQSEFERAMKIFVISDLVVTVALYFLLPRCLLKIGRPVRAGFSMLAVAFVGLMLMAGVTNDDMPGAGILLFLLLPLPLVLIGYGAAVKIVRLIKTRRNPAA